MHGRSDVLAMHYVETWPIEAVADAASNTPAMLLEVSFAGRSERVWLAPETPNMPDGLEMRALLPPAENQQRAPEVTLYLVRPTSQIRRYQARLAVLESGRRVAGKTIEVNRPLHYGGFHVYWHYCDPVDPRYVLLSVRSDSGLAVVYAGFALLCGGIFAWGWAGPAWKLLSRRSDNGD